MSAIALDLASLDARFRHTIDDVRELQQQSARGLHTQEGNILPTSPGGADSMNEATIASFDPMIVSRTMSPKLFWTSEKCRREGRH